MLPAGLAEALAEAERILAAAGVPTPRVDAELLAAHLLDESVGRVRALAYTDAPAPQGLAELVDERARRVPLQHLTGTAYFRHLELAVGPGVFIPRPETETVVQLVIDHATALLHTREAGETRLPPAPVNIIDLGTGSGAIAGAVAQELPQVQVFAVELSELAHSWAERNLRPLGVRLERADMRDAFADRDGTFDVVVSNPPYIPPGALPNEPEVADYDPPVALYGGGEEGMQLPLAAMATGRRLLRPGGYFVMEHAEVQAGLVARALAEQECWAAVETHPDLNGRPRATSAVLRQGSAESAGAAESQPDRVMKEYPT